MLCYSRLTQCTHGLLAVLPAWTETILTCFNVLIAWSNCGRSQDDTLALPNADHVLSTVTSEAHFCNIRKAIFDFDAYV